MGNVCSRCFGYLNGIQIHAFEPGKVELRTPDNQVEILSIKQCCKDEIDSSVRKKILSQDDAEESQNERNGEVTSSQRNGEVKTPIVPKISNKGVIIILSTPDGEQICNLDDNAADVKSVMIELTGRTSGAKGGAGNEGIETQTEQSPMEGGISNETEAEKNEIEKNRKPSKERGEEGVEFCIESKKATIDQQTIVKPSSGSKQEHSALIQLSERYSKKTLKMALSDLTETHSGLVTRDAKKDVDGNISLPIGKSSLPESIVNSFASDMANQIIQTLLSSNAFKVRTYSDSNGLYSSVESNCGVPVDSYDGLTFNLEKEIYVSDFAKGHNIVQSIEYSGFENQRQNGKPANDRQLGTTVAESIECQTIVEDRVVAFLVQRAIKDAVLEVNRNEVAVSRNEVARSIADSSLEGSKGCPCSLVDLNCKEHDNPAAVNSKSDSGGSDLKAVEYVAPYCYDQSRKKRHEMEANISFSHRPNSITKYGHQMSTRIIFEAIGSI